MDNHEKNIFCKNLFDIYKCDNIKKTDLCKVYMEKQYKKCIKIITKNKL
jgi:hypothetical protein